MADKKRITKVTTRAGDKGNTKLATGKTIAKHDPLIMTVGAVDELNSHIGVLLATLANDNHLQAQDGHVPVLKEIQQNLFNMGAVFAMEGAFDAPDLTPLEKVSSQLNDALPPLTEFVLPGGGMSATQAHICRAVCRRSEAMLWGVIADLESAETPASYRMSARYLNRLSDYFFVLARTITVSPEEEWRK